MIKIVVLPLQVVFASFVSNIIQFTFVPSVTTHSFIKINADTVWFHITHVVTKTHCQNFNDANDVVYKTSSIKCFFRGKLQLSALVCVKEVIYNYKKRYKKSKTLIGEIAIIDVKMILTLVIVILMMVRFSSEVKHLLMISVSEYN